MESEYRSQPVRLNMAEQLQNMVITRRDRHRLSRLGLRAAKVSRPDPSIDPILFFNASARLTGLSQNAAFSFLTALGLQQAGIPVIHFGCRSGMTRCVLGTVRRTPQESPPCQDCISQSERLFGHAPIVWSNYKPNEELSEALNGLDIQTLSRFKYPFGNTMIPLGFLTVNSIRWALRLHDLEDDNTTRFFMREYIKSCYQLATDYAVLLDRLEPGALVIFNGILYPEAAARWVGLLRGYRVVTYEVAYQPFSAFFSDGLATRYPIDIPKNFELSTEQNQLINNYLENRFQGNFTMAGIQFWPEIRALDENLVEKMKQFRQIVPIFTNVIYDTSQIDTNVAFAHMFDWLDHLLPIIRNHVDTLFVIRAHPDEMRPGKESRQSVQQWIAINQVLELPNVVFIPSREFISSYSLIHHSKFVLVYNSSIGLEAVLLGKPVVGAAVARYTQYPIVYFPKTVDEFQQRVHTMLTSDHVLLPDEFLNNARRFLYYQLYRASLPFDDFIESSARPGFVHLRNFPLEALHPDRSHTIQVIRDGLISQQPFLLPDSEIIYER